MLERVKQENEVNLQLKAEEKRRLIEEDNRYNQLFEEELAKQERLRQEQLEKMKQWQAKAEKEAQGRPEAKRWIDERIIEGYLKKKEEADRAKDEAKARRLAEENERTRQMLDEQVRTKEELRKAAKEQEFAFAAKIAKDVQAAKEMDVSSRAGPGWFAARGVHASAGLILQTAAAFAGRSEAGRCRGQAAYAGRAGPADEGGRHPQARGAHDGDGAADQPRQDREGHPAGDQHDPVLRPLPYIHDSSFVETGRMHAIQCMPRRSTGSDRKEGYVRRC